MNKDTPSWAFGRSAKGQVIDKTKDNPPPGNYDLPGTLDKRGASISGRHPDLAEKRTAFVPGPGAYDPSLRTDNPQFSIGRSTRDKDGRKSNDIPGPGSYNPAAQERASSAIVGKSTRTGLAQPSIVPGPGAYYSAEGKKPGPQFSFRAKVESKGREQSPGPGQYDHTGFGYVLERPSSAVWAADRSTHKENSLNKTMPGPGQYDLINQSRGPNYSFGSEQRKWLKEDPNPGPGTYSVPATVDRRSASISGRHPVVDKKEVPGPGTYNPSGRDKSPAFSVGRGQRSELATSGVGPGPGQYATRESLSRQGVRFGTGERDGDNRKTTVPGPGNYAVKTSIGEGPSYSLRGKVKADALPDNPGPGAYSHNPAAVQERSPQVSFSREGKGDTRNHSVDSTGPGMYYSPKQAAGVKWSFGQEKKGTVVKAEGPGPGAYELKSTIADLPGYSKSSK